MMKKKSAEYFFINVELWREELKFLRSIIKETTLVETFKWNFPVYTINGKNVVGLGSFKSYFGIWFFQGVFLEDKAGKLINAQEGKTKAMRQWRFNAIDEIDKHLVLKYLKEAIENQKQGKEIKPERKKGLQIPNSLAVKFEELPKLKASFEKLIPSKQREYAEYVDEAKREATKQKRLEKIIPMIFENIGLNDKYK